MIKIVAVFACLFMCTFSMSAQEASKSIAVSGYLKKLDMIFESKNSDLKLNDAQRIKIEAIVSQRETKKQSLNLKNLDKSAISKALTAIDDEFQPEIEKVFTEQQKDVYRTKHAVKH